MYNVHGQEVSPIISSFQDPGAYESIFNGEHLSGGVYFYALQAGNFRASPQIILQRKNKHVMLSPSVD
ncbi:MAG: hypothetical protein ACI86L_002172 [Dokdonia sp.]